MNVFSIWEIQRPSRCFASCFREKPTTADLNKNMDRYLARYISFICWGEISALGSTGGEDSGTDGKGDGSSTFMLVISTTPKQ